MAVVQYTFTYKQHTEQHSRQKQYIEQHNSLIGKSVDRARLCEVYSGICLRKKDGKNLSQINRRMTVGMMKTEYTEQSICNKKNT